VTSAEVVNSKGIMYSIDEHLKNFKGIKYRIISYDVTRMSSITGETIVDKSCRTLQTGKGSQVIRNAEPGDYIIINNIKYRTANGKKYTSSEEIVKIIK
jgi:hypothetical protein